MLRRRIRAHYEQLSEFVRGCIIRLKEAGWTNWRIARHMGQSGAAIRRCWQEWVNNGRFQRHDGSSRRRATTYREDKLIVRSVVIEPGSSLSTIRHATRTRKFTMNIHRWLIERNLPSYGPLRHLQVMPAHCQARLQWCLALSAWNNADWVHIVFNDESCFQLCPDYHRRRVWRRPG
ncbi:HTH_Tnp_Tc3_2 domain-containing protein [Trichonephila clavipes]|nr:HTH_Tnp_Tc3_2 domain-containing protein [Trichonephila clavipes]